MFQIRLCFHSDHRLNKLNIYFKSGKKKKKLIECKTLKLERVLAIQQTQVSEKKWQTSSHVYIPVEGYRLVAEKLVNKLIFLVRKRLKRLD